METLQTELVNDVIYVHNSGIDWVAWIALLVSIGATLVTLWWQNRIRKSGLDQQRKDKIADDKMRKWSAEYPHKLKLFTDFYDILFRFVNYTGTARELLTNSGTQRFFVTKICISDLLEFYSQINRIDEECKILFPGDIERRIHDVYGIMNHFIYSGLNEDGQTMFNAVDILENNQRCLLYNNLKANLEHAQNEIRRLKLEYDLREMFQEALRAPECKDE